MAASRLVSSMSGAWRSSVLELTNPWYAVDILKAGWVAGDSALHAIAPSVDLHHRTLDVLISSLKSSRSSWPGAYYSNGFGDPEVISKMLRRLKGMRYIDQQRSSHESAGTSTAAQLREDGTSATGSGRSQEPWMAGTQPQDDQSMDIASLQVSLTRSAHGRKYAHVCEGSYVPPATWLPHLPPEAHTGYLQLITPTCWADPTVVQGAARDSDTARIQAEMSAVRPIVILLAGTGEHGFTRRRHCMAYPLAKLGIGSVLVEIPFYGRRKPAAQVASKLAHLTDLSLQGCAVIEESRALVAWLAGQPSALLPLVGALPGLPGLGGSSSPARGQGSETSVSEIAAHAASLSMAGHQGTGLGSSGMEGAQEAQGQGYGAIVLGGTSMGGLHAAMTACTLPASLPVGVASWLGPPSAAAVYTQGRLAHGVDWPALVQHATHAARGPQLQQGVISILEATQALEPRGEGVEPMPRTRTPAPSVTHFLSRSLPASMRKGGDDSLRHAQMLAAQVLQSTDLLNFGRPARSDAAVFITARSDQYVPAQDVALAAMWARIQRVWQGCAVRQVRGGHVSASLFQLDSFCAVVAEVVRKLQQGKAGAH